MDSRNFRFSSPRGVYFRSSCIFEVPPRVGTWAGGGEGGSGKWIAATLSFLLAAGYTFGVLAFLRSLRGWGPGLGEEREGGREWEVDSRNFSSGCSGAGCTFGVLAFLRSLRGWGPGLGEEREGLGSG